jgi:macrolide transport system ATP-binding/permease protein
MAVLKNVMSHAMAQALLGLAIGIPLAYAVGRYLVGHVAQVAASGPAVATVHMYQVAAFDPVIVAVSVASLAAAATIAALLPARRAASVNPIEALRTE